MSHMRGIVHCGATAVPQYLPATQWNELLLFTNINNNPATDTGYPLTLERVRLLYSLNFSGGVPSGLTQMGGFSSAIVEHTLTLPAAIFTSDNLEAVLRAL